MEYSGELPTCIYISSVASTDRHTIKSLHHTNSFNKQQRLYSPRLYAPHRSRPSALYISPSFSIVPLTQTCKAKRRNRRNRRKTMLCNTDVTKGYQTLWSMLDDANNDDAETKKKEKKKSKERKRELWDYLYTSSLNSCGKRLNLPEPSSNRATCSSAGRSPR